MFSFYFKQNHRLLRIYGSTTFFLAQICIYIVFITPLSSSSLPTIFIKYKNIIFSCYWRKISPVITIPFFPFATFVIKLYVDFPLKTKNLTIFLFTMKIQMHLTSKHSIERKRKSKKGKFFLAENTFPSNRLTNIKWTKAAAAQNKKKQQQQVSEKQVFLFFFIKGVYCMYCTSQCFI